MQTRPLPFWLMIVSIAIAVLPVWRSPMISSRWPRPIGISASIALMPVWTGVSTDLRTMTPGAIRSTGRVFVAAIGPLSSSGRPSGSTTRPSSAWPTGTSTTRPVVLTVSPSLIARGVAEDDRADRLLLEVQGHAHHPAGELEHLGREGAVEPVDLGDAVADLDDRADAARLGRRVERVDRRLDDAGDLVGADGHESVLLQGARGELVPQPLEAAPDAPVDESVADADDEPAEQALVDVGGRARPAAGHLLEAGREGLDLESVSGAALVAVAWVIPWRRSSRRANSAATRGSCSIRPRRTRSRMRLRTGWLRPANTRSAVSQPLVERQRRVGEDGHQLALGRRGRAARAHVRHVSIEPSRSASWKAASA